MYFSIKSGKPLKASHFCKLAMSWLAGVHLVVALGQGEQRLGANHAFEMNMDFRFRHLRDQADSCAS